MLRHLYICSVEPFVQAECQRYGLAVLKNPAEDINSDVKLEHEIKPTASEEAHFRIRLSRLADLGRRGL